MSFLGGLIGGITGFLTGGPIGAVAGVIGGASAGGGAGGALQAGVYRGLPQAGGTNSAALPGVIGQPLGIGSFRNPLMTGATRYGRQGFADLPVDTGGGGTAMVSTATGTALACTTKGQHLNKSHYFRKPHGLAENIGHWGGAVEVDKGTVCVKNRRMNVGNAKALRHALRRARGFEKLAMRTIRILHPGRPKRFGGFKTRRRSR